MSTSRFRPGVSLRRLATGLAMVSLTVTVAEVAALALLWIGPSTPAEGRAGCDRPCAGSAVRVGEPAHEVPAHEVPAVVRMGDRPRR